MTVMECYEMAVGFLPEDKSDNAEMQKFMVKWCNQLLVETFANENSYRRAQELPELSEVPKVESQNEEIPYNERLVRAAFPYGMARWVFRENDDIDGSREYYTLYAAAANDSTPVNLAEVQDVY